MHRATDTLTKSTAVLVGQPWSSAKACRQTSEDGDASWKGIETHAWDSSFPDLEECNGGSMHGGARVLFGGLDLMEVLCIDLFGFWRLGRTQRSFSIV